MTADKPTWFLSRGGQTFGPYTWAQIQSWAQARQLAPTDVVCREDAPTWVPAGSVPGLFPAEAASGPSFFGRLKFHLGRATEWNLRAVTVRPEEEKELLAVGVDDPSARAYHAWRRSVLLVVAAVSIVTGAVGVVSAAAADRQGLTEVGMIFEVLQAVLLFVMPIAAWRAASTWAKHRRSRRVLAIGWTIALAMPLLLSLVPLHWRLQLGTDDPMQSNIFRLLGAIDRFVSLAPVFLALIPGVLRACIRVKVLLPQSILPGWFLVAASPLYVLLFFIFFATINQLAGNPLLIGGVLCLAGAPVLYLFHVSLFTSPLAPGEDYERLVKVQKQVRLVLIGGVILVLIWLFTGDIMGKRIIGLEAETSFVRPWNPDLFKFPLDYGAHSLFTMSLVADMIMLMNLSLWQQMRKFGASPEAAEYDRAMSEIEEAGGRE